MTHSSLKLIRKVIRTTTEWFTLVVMGDLHIGQKATDEDQIKGTIDWLKDKDPTTHGLLLTGDLIENVLPSSKGSSFEMAHVNPQDQMDIAVDLLTPAKEHIIAMCDGNHEYRTMKAAGIKVMERMAERLGTKNYYGYRCFVSLELARRSGKMTYDIYVEHGAGSVPNTVSGRYTKLAKIQGSAEADVYIKGHVHHKLAFPRVVWRREGGRMVRRKVMFVSNGSYLIDPEYGIRSEYEPTESGVAKVLLSTERYNIHCTI